MFCAAAIADQVQTCRGDSVCACLRHRAVWSTASALKLCVPGFVCVCLCMCACVCLCVHGLPLPSFLSLFRPARSVWLPTEHIAAKYTHISKHSTTTDRVLVGQRGAGNSSKGEFRETNRLVSVRERRREGE